MSKRERGHVAYPGWIFDRAYAEELIGDSPLEIIFEDLSQVLWVNIWVPIEGASDDRDRRTLEVVDYYKEDLGDMEALEHLIDLIIDGTVLEVMGFPREIPGTSPPTSTR